MNRAHLDKERGAALLTILLWVAIVGAIAAAALDRLRLSTKLASNASAVEQARALASGVEQLLVLAIDDVTASDTLPRNGDAALLKDERSIQLPLGGHARVALRDGGNCFNINSVGEGDDPSRIMRRPTGIAQFQALMVILGVPAKEARSISSAAGDWVDADTAVEPAGAEDATYAQMKPAYRAGNTLFADVSELRAVAGMTAIRFEQLRPWLCALPNTDLSPINLNTLGGEQAPLLAMLAPDQISIARARQVLEQRPRGGWTSLSDFYQVPAMRAVVLPGVVQFQPQLRTGWVRGQILITYQQAEVSEFILIDGRAKPARLIMRQWGDEG